MKKPAASFLLIHLSKKKTVLNFLSANWVDPFVRQIDDLLLVNANPVNLHGLWKLCCFVR